MSHFTVMVKVSQKKLNEHHGNIENAIAELLGPYCEDTKNIDEEFLKFNDETAYYMRTYKKDKMNVLVREDGQEEDLYSTKEWKLAFGKAQEKAPDGVWPSNEDVLKEFKKEHKVVTRSVNKVYLTFKQYMQDRVGKDFDEKTGKYGYWSNPNAKWDWWQVGGRWSGMLKTKDGNVDIAKVKNVDWDHLKKQAADEIIRRYEEMKEYWDIVSECNNNIDAIAKAFKNKNKDPFYHFNMYDTAMQLGLIQGNGKLEQLPKKQEFIEKFASYDEFSTHAVIETNGEWLTKGEVGWFGCSSETPDEARKWEESFFDNFIAQEDPETTLVIVDCHI